MRYRVTIRGDKAELRGYFTTHNPDLYRELAQAVTPLGMLIVSPAADDYNPFRSGVNESVLITALDTYRSTAQVATGHQNHGTHVASMRAALEAVHEPDRADYDAGYKAGLRAAFSEASIQVLRDSDGYESIPPSKFEGEYGKGAAAVMNWLNEAIDAPVPPREES